MWLIFLLNQVWGFIKPPVIHEVFDFSLFIPLCLGGFNKDEGFIQVSSLSSPYIPITSSLIRTARSNSSSLIKIANTRLNRLAWLLDFATFGMWRVSSSIMPYIAYFNTLH